MYIEVRKSEKTGNKYVALVADLGYTQKLLNFNKFDLAELADMSVRDLTELEVGTKIEVNV